MRDTFATSVRAIAGVVPSAVGSAMLLGAWIALTALFTLAGNVLLLTVVTAVGKSLGPALVLMTVVGVFGTPAASLVLAQRVVATTVRRLEPVVARESATLSDSEHFDSSESNEQVHCRTAECC